MKFFQETCAHVFKKPIMAMPVNEVGNRNPENFQQISAETISGVDYVVQFRQDDLNKPIKPSIIKLGKGNLFQLIK